MPVDVIMPQMGESVTEGTVTRWLVEVGDSVKRDQPLLEISTDKVDAEIPSPADGVLLETRVQEGDIAQVDQVVAIIGDRQEAAVDAAPAEHVEEVATAAVPVSEPSSVAAAAEAEATSDDDVVADEADLIRRRSSPVVRKMAAEHDVDISRIEGTGIHGRVTRRDMEEHLASRATGKVDAVSVAAAESRPGAVEGRSEIPPPRDAVLIPTKLPQADGFSVAPYAEGDNVEIVPMTKIRQITAAHMSYSKATSAHVSSVFHMDLSKIAKIRELARHGFAEAHGTKLTYMPFIFKAVAAALKANPKLNAAIDGTNIVFKKDVNIGMAVALDWGLIVPVIRHADQLNLVGLARTANDLADRARRKKLSPEEVQGGTFTVTNPGVFGSLFGVPIINQPQVGILGIGTIEKRPVVDTDADGNDLISIKPMSYFALTFDHRLVDGADADAFMNDLKRMLLEERWSELEPFC